MKKANKLMLGSVLAASMGVVGTAQAELSGNIGFTSNYIWRGVTQTNDRSAISGGIDYSQGDFYIGTWVSNLDGGNYEQDVYLGYGFKAGSVDLDVGYIGYMYPTVSGSDFSEVYINATFGKFSAGYAYTTGSDDDTTAEFSKGDTYIYIGAEFEVKKDLSLSLTYGDYDFDDPAGTDYSHYQVALSKDDFSFAYESNDLSGAAGEARYVVSYSKSFDL